MDWYARLMECWNDPIFDKYRGRCYGMFCQGSQNHENLVTEDSDMDVVAIILPTKLELATCAKPVSIELLRDNDEHIKVWDYRKWIDLLKKSNFNAIELLYSKYSYINEDYKSYKGIHFKEIFAMREHIAHIDHVTFVKNIGGLAQSYYLKGREKANKNLRFYWSFLVKYLAGYSYLDCLTKDISELIGNDLGPYSNEEYLKIINELVNYCLDTNHSKSEYVIDFLNNCACNILEDMFVFEGD